MMNQVKMMTGNLPDMPWKEKPKDWKLPVWRYENNPIIRRNPLEGVARIFNSAVIPYEGAYIGVFRAEQTDGVSHLYLGRSTDGISWEFEKEKIAFINEAGEPFQPRYAYDPRLLKLEDAYYIIWCTDFYGASIGLARTKDFKTFVRLENPFLPFNRNGMLFPRKINGNYMMLSRPSDSGHTPFGDIFLSESPDLVYWGKHRHVMSRGDRQWWQTLKIGGGPIPIETSEGWLLIYHGVTSTCSGYIYSMGVAILDLENPSIVKYRSDRFIMTPEEWYEEHGFVPNVVFPCATLADEETGRIAIYYGAADSYVGLAFTTVDELVAYAKENHREIGDDGEIGIR